MKELIEIQHTLIGAENVNSVNSRDLYNDLGLSKGQYVRWSQKNILDLFYLNEDYIGVRQIVEGNDVISYMVTFDVAKHLCMMSKTDKAMKIRKYFIDVEKQSKVPQQFQLPQNYIEALEALTISEKEKLVLTHTIEEKDKVILAVADLNIKAGEVSIGDFSKNIAIEGLGRNNLFTWLRGRGFLMDNTAPYQPYVDRGYFVRRPSNKRIHGETRYTTLLTPRGTVWLTKMLKAEFDLD